MNIATQIGPACSEGQGFALNFNPSYHAGGLVGHTGIDIACGYGTPIEALIGGLVYTTYPIEHPASDGYTAVFTICETPLEVFEFSYGHVSEIDCAIGQTVNKGDVIAKEGNHGTVYAGNTLITLAMQAAGDHDGHHRHYQKRPVIKTKTLNGQALSTAQGTYRDEDGNYYQVYDYKNGFNGCVDWTLPLFNRDLSYVQGNQMTGYDVYLLQKVLVLEVGFDPADCIGTFGPKTKLAVEALQKKHNIAPVAGYCGALTRGYLNGTYKQL
jgi:hypothetical protein